MHRHSLKSDKRRILLVEDDEGLRTQLRWQLGDYEVLMAGSRDEALAQVRASEPEVALLDLGLPPAPDDATEGFATLDSILKLAPSTKVVVMTGQDGRENALRAIGAGAYDFLAKPVPAENMTILLDRAFYLSGLEAENRRLQASAVSSQLPGLLGDSPAIAKVCRMAERVARTDVSVVVLGESGTGKEVVARAIHELSGRRGRKFVAINCAAIPGALLEAELFGYERGAFTGAVKQTQGKLELADGGTLFLDEIGDLPLELQSKLLRFIQERVIERLGGRQEIPVDIRILCATHRDLARLVTEGGFREDLYYRLTEIVIPLPSLRDRTGDAVLIAHHFLNHYNKELERKIAGFSPEALRAIDAYSWPGNIRELQNKLKRAVIMAEGRLLTPVDLDLDEQKLEPDFLNLRKVRERAESEALLRVLAQTGGNVSRAAALLGISRPTLYDLMRQYGLRD